MGKHLVFLLHGMGTHGSDWADETLEVLRASYAEYGNLSGSLPLDERCRFIPVTYNEQFEAYLEQTRLHAANLTQWNEFIGLGNDAGLIEQLVGIAARPPSDKFLVTHLGDVLLYMLTDYREVIKHHVADQIIDEIRTGAPEGYSIIAHSLGTRVLTDVMQMWCTEPAINWPAFGKPRFIMMIANVTRLLQQLTRSPGDVYHNAVFPDADPGQGACSYYITTRHELDPFMWGWPFIPPDDFGPDPSHTWQLRLDAGDLTGKNPHDAAHYMRNPKIHRALIRALVRPDRDGLFERADVDRVDAAYRQSTLAGTVAATRTELEALKVRRGANLMDALGLIRTWQEFLESVR